MKLLEVITPLELDEDLEELEIEWDDITATLPEDGVFFLRPDFIHQACQDCGFPEEVEQTAQAVAEHIAASPSLRELAWYLHACVFRAKNRGWQRLDLSAALEKGLPGRARMFYVLLVFSGLPAMKELHRQRGIPESVTQETLADLKLYLNADIDRVYRDELGFSPHMVFWFLHHLKGELYQLGRLQFQLGSFWYKARAYRRNSDGLVIALSEPGVRYRTDGQVAEGEEEAETWTATLEVNEDVVVGYPILPTSRAVPKQIALSAAEWRPALLPGDRVVHVHMPPGSPLAFDACGESFRRAAAFFPRYFPDFNYVGFACGSWLLNTWLEELIPPPSNIVRFQREVYLLPIGFHAPTMLMRIFGRVPDDLLQAPRNTKLRRAVLEAVEKGGGLHHAGGACFLLPEDLDWGSQVYRRQQFPWDLT
jgi:hypothetical protein